MLSASIIVYFVVFSGAVLTLWKRSGFDLLHPVVLFLIYLFVQIGASNVLYIQFDLPSELSLPLPQYTDRYVEATWLAILATVLVLIGAVAVGNRRLALTAPLPRVSSAKLKVLMLVAFPVGFWALWLLIEINGGFSEFLANRETWRAGEMRGQGPLFFPATGLLNLFALLNLARVYAQGGSTISKRFALALLVLSVAPAVLMGFRLSILIPLFQGLAVVHYSSGKVPPLRIAAFLLAALTLFTAYGIHRELGWAGSESGLSDLAEERPTLVFAVLARSRGADVVANIIDTLDATGEYDYGLHSLVELLTIWLPSSLWEGKPVHSNMRFGTQFFGPTLAATRQGFDGYFGGVSATFVGETYWHLGLVGVIVMSCLWGALGQLLYNALNQTKRSEFTTVLLVACWSSYAMSAECIQVFANGLMINVIALAALFLVAHRASRTRGAPGSASVTSAPGAR